MSVLFVLGSGATAKGPQYQAAAGAVQQEPLLRQSTQQSFARHTMPDCFNYGACVVATIFCFFVVAAAGPPAYSGGQCGADKIRQCLNRPRAVHCQRGLPLLQAIRHAGRAAGETGGRLIGACNAMPCSRHWRAPCGMWCSTRRSRQLLGCAPPVSRGCRTSNAGAEWCYITPLL